MADGDDRASRFLALHEGPLPLLQPNAWDVGSARVLAALGFEAVATTSSGFAASLGRPDGLVTRDEALRHAAEVAAAVDIPVAADTENGFADDPDGVAETVTLACSTGVAGCSVEDYAGARRPADAAVHRNGPMYERGLARARVASAAEAAHAGPVRLVLTARCDNLVHGIDDLADTVARLQDYQDAGADVLFAPGLRTARDIATVVSSVDRPVSVLARPGCPPVDELAELGVARVSVGGAFAFVAYGALLQAARELRDAGTYRFWDRVVEAGPFFRDVFG